MSFSQYSASIPLLTRSLQNLKAIIEKAQVFAETKKVKPEVIAASRLAVDMLPLSAQIQIACDNAKGCGARLAGVDNPSYEDNEKTLEELKLRIERTLEFLGKLKPEQFEGSEDKAIVLSFPNVTLNFSGQDYISQFVLPNFYFHVTTAYAILRHIGVELGKGDYLGRVGG
ncbi:DUF1993 domain-containing protein [Neptunicella sp. SCSIO 80796]|uniref:DUF1993 domain-containing protein n=1 Tax=Neptunicella plasticusilytica TaxID=3117012 RepID=UPI003A4DB52A